MNKKIYCLLFAFIAVVAASAKKPTASQEARRLFDKAYEQVFGEKGSSFSYDVNIASLYRTKGTISMKGRKSKFTDERVDAWSDGVTAYMVYRKKKTIEIHNAASDKKDKYSGKFKFTLDDFDYSMSQQSDGLLFTLKQKKNAKGTIKEVKALVDAKTYAPKQLKVKVMFFHATVTISNFHAGGLSDKLFVFPRANYGSDYKYVDKRQDQ